MSYCIKKIYYKVLLVNLLIINTCISYTFSRECDCGLSGIQRRVYGGNETYENQYPWIVHLRFFDYVGSKHYGLCGGSLIDHQHILTAAHCVHDPRGNPRDIKAIQVFLGAHNILLLPKAKKVSKIIIPRNYSFKKPVHYDIAIIKLAKPVKFSSKISPICIPKSDEEPYYELTVAGWGHLGPRRRISTSLQHVDVYHVPKDKCYLMVKKYLYRTYPILKVFPSKFKIPSIHWNHMCAVDSNTGGDACQGDSGGPLMYYNPDNSRYYLIGIVSGAYDKCGDKSTPGFYTIVKNFRKMIKTLAPSSYICNY